MDTRFIFSALIGIFCLIMVLAAITTVRHIANRPEPTVSRAG
jgi:hypothetical protein